MIGALKEARVGMKLSGMWRSTASRRQPAYDRRNRYSSPGWFESSTPMSAGAGIPVTQQPMAEPSTLDIQGRKHSQEKVMAAAPHQEIARRAMERHDHLGAGHPR